MSTVMEFGIVGGLIPAVVAKTLLRFGWRRMAAPKGRHRAIPGKATAGLAGRPGILTSRE